MHIFHSKIIMMMNKWHIYITVCIHVSPRFQSIYIITIMGHNYMYDKVAQTLLLVYKSHMKYLVLGLGNG